MNFICSYFFKYGRCFDDEISERSTSRYKCLESKRFYHWRYFRRSIPRTLVTYVNFEAICEQIEGAMNGKLHKQIFLLELDVICIQRRLKVHNGIFYQIHESFSPGGPKSAQCLRGEIAKLQKKRDNLQ